MKLFNFFNKTKQPIFVIGDSLTATIVLDGTTHVISASHPNHGVIIEALTEKDFSVLSGLVDMPKAIQEYSDGKIVINEYGEVSYDGEELHNSVTRRITEFFQQGLDFKPLVRFLENLMSNPSKRAVEELYNFLNNDGMAITEDGCFVGYKGVRENFMDKHTGTFDNSPGQVHKMERNLVDDDARKRSPHTLSV